MKLPSIRRVGLDASRAAQRFPFVLFCALAMTISAVILLESEAKKSMGFPIFFAAALGLPSFAALAFCAQKQKWSAGLFIGSQLCAVILLVGYGCSVPTSFPYPRRISSCDLDCLRPAWFSLL
jgi:peptidoglycan/LPS O-acetylase OafA/YrhL